MIQFYTIKGTIFLLSLELLCRFIIKVTKKMSVIFSNSFQFASYLWKNFNLASSVVNIVWNQLCLLNIFENGFVFLNASSFRKFSVLEFAFSINCHSIYQYESNCGIEFIPSLSAWFIWIIVYLEEVIQLKMYGVI